MTATVTVDMDVGGTFADGFFTHDQHTAGVKVDTTPHDLTLCFWACLEAGADALGFARVAAMLASTAVIRFATTIGTNAILQGKGPQIGMLVSQGYEQSLYGDAATSPLVGRFVSSDLIMPVRIGSDGAPDEAATRAALKELLNLGARHLVIALHGSGQDDRLETEVAGIVRRYFPTHFLGSMPLVMSSAVRPRLDDFSRTNVAVLNAYLHRDLAAALYRAEDRLRDEGYGRPLLVTQSSGGAARVAKTRAIDTYNSGPVAGLFGCAEFARRYSLHRALTVDVGGTSTDIGVVEGGSPRYRFQSQISGIPVDLPFFEVDSIACGGGSIARPTDNGTVNVGPDSAGAVPGPVAYGLGGAQPTVTDAYLVLGYLDPAFFLGGQRRLDGAAAERAIRKELAEPLGLSVEDAALAVVAEVVRLIRRAVESTAAPEGVSGAAIFAFGGGGGLIAAALGQALGATVWLFESGAVLNAFGSSQMDVVHTYERSMGSSIDATTAGLVQTVLEDFEARAVRDMRGEGFGGQPISYLVELEVESVDGGARLIQTEHGGDWQDTAHRAIADGVDGRATALRMRASVGVPHAPIMPRESSEAGADVAPRGTRRIVLPSGPVEAPVYDRRTLASGQVISGPALVEASDTTILVPDDFQLAVDIYGNASITTPNEAKPDAARLRARLERPAPGAPSAA